ncbi:NFX1-type zinc finger-containing protein 1 isoform X1 [Oceanobacillus picturae]|uniref:NFX1-type zinc finger-containing protein 1 isoform X1 n=1 Tax=Oceanobacillus picturae TaxID=171693 RepID=A0A0U9H9Y9_9BACI|nr:NFX1-type zinc finger-containing protein 1 isoform X1 [Oceanobacillus picturae]
MLNEYETFYFRRDLTYLTYLLLKCDESKRSGEIRSEIEFVKNILSKAS